MARACYSATMLGNETCLLTSRDAAGEMRAQAMDERLLWFAVQVTPNHEVAVDTLLGCKGYERFLPTHMVNRKWSDRIKTLQQPMFPGYIFCRSQRAAVAPILRTSGVIRLVNCGGKLCSVSESEIEGLRQVVQSKKETYVVPFLAVGRRVQVKDGPLAGIVGIITKLKNRDRLVLSVELIMRSVAVEVDTWEVAISLCSATG
jgi:transcription antitermination factor NusG